MAGGGEGVLGVGEVAEGKVSAVVVRLYLWDDKGFVSMQVCAVLRVRLENPVDSAVLLGLCCDCAAPVGDEVTWSLDLLKLGSVETTYWFSSFLWLGPAQATCVTRSVDSGDATIVLTFSLKTRTTVWVLGTSGVWDTVGGDTGISMWQPMSGL